MPHQTSNKSPSPPGRGLGVRVRPKPELSANSYPHPALWATFSRGEKGKSRKVSPSPTGRGEK